MASNTPKRRKTSPAPAPNLQSQTPTRASFLSPTRASLSRFNPSLLPQPTLSRSSPSRQLNRTPVPISDPRTELLAKGEAALNYIMGGINKTMRPQPREGVITGEETDEQMEAMRAANAARRESERLESQRPESERRDIQKPENEDRDRQRPESESRETQRPKSGRSTLPPHETGRAHRHISEPEVEDTFQQADEDELPETPEALRRQLDIDDAPPRGILFSSPTKKRKRKNRFKEPVMASEEMNMEEGPVAIANSATQVQSQVTQPIREKHLQKDPGLILKEEEKEKLRKELESLEDEIGRYEEFIQEFERLDDDQAPSNMKDLM
jgi:hypothetical protein